MPKISLWKNYKDNDFYYIDKMIGEYFDLSASGILVHKYLGPEGKDSTVTTIQDLLFLENRSRKYGDELFELRGLYQPQDADFDLSQFGIFLSNDTIFISFHYSNMISSIGRKLMSGDVLEFQHLRDPDSLTEDRQTLNRFYVIEDASHSAEGYGPKWWSHIWRVKAKLLKDSPEFSDILGHGGDAKQYNADGDFVGLAGTDTDLKNSISTYCKDIEITDGIVDMAEANVKFDPKWADAAHMYVDELASGQFNYYMWSGDGVPPNGKTLSGYGDEFPNTLVDGDFFLRTDFAPNRLFRKHGNKYIKIEDDIRFKWTAYNRILDTFIDNKDTDVMTDGTTAKQRKALSKSVKPKINYHTDKQDSIKKGE